MIERIAILGSTGSIGKSLLNLISKNKKKYKIELLTANTKYKELISQTKKFNVTNVIITDPTSYKNFIKKNKNKKINVFQNFESLSKIIKKKIDYTMSSIVGLDGLEPTLKIIKYTKRIAIANKESIICGWNLINKEINKNNVEFIPVDSEHFSIWYAIKNFNITNVEKIYITASGGPLLNYPTNKLNKIKITQVIKHPTWQMGRKISVDSATMMNKVFEVIEANKIFNIAFKKLSILIHPSSYIHSIIKFENGLVKLIAHDTTMEIPIFNTLNKKKNMNISFTKGINLNALNDLKLSMININKFPLINVLKHIPEKNSLFETVIVSANDELVNLFLKKKIKYDKISTTLLKFIKNKEFLKYKKIQPTQVSDIVKLSKYVRLKIRSLSV